jgi:histone chaperone ASF1
LLLLLLLLLLNLLLTTKADPPNTAKIPADDAVGVTVVLITASYRDQEFVRVGSYVNNEYDDPELKDNPPSEPLFDKLVRTIASDQPRVTKFKINWDSASQAAAAAAAAGEQASAAASSDLAGNVNSQDSEMAVESNGLGSTQPIAAAAANNNSNSNFENKENINDEMKKKLSITENSKLIQENGSLDSVMS